jgi:hypothetical protein
MRKSDIDFDDIDMFDAWLEPPLISGSQLSVQAKDLLLMPGARDGPGFERIEPVASAVFLFHGVSSSQRTLHEYRSKEQAKDCLPPRIEEDGPFPGNPEGSREFLLEGRYPKPLSFVSWVIQAQDFELFVDDEDKRDEEKEIPVD